MKTNSAVEPQALSIREACTFAGISKSKMYQLVSAQAVKTRRLDRRRLILRSDLQEFLENLPTD
jgi:excisionase family DNA binding protein